jgi:hypothetical protein
MFQDLIKGLNEKGAGVRAYDACARAARARIAQEPQNAAALLLISYAAQLFVDSYDDQPLTVDMAGDEFTRFSAIVEKLDGAAKSGKDDAMLAAVNDVAAQLAQGPRG